MIFAMQIYPITGPFRELLVILELLTMFFSYELAIYFAYRYWKARKDPAERQTEGLWNLYLSCWGGLWFFIVIADFYAVTPQDRNLALILGYLIEAIGIWFFVLIFELRLGKGFTFTVVFTLMLIVLILQFFFLPQAVQPFLLVGGVFWNVLITIHTLRLNREARFGPKFFIFFALGFGLILVGFGGTMDFTIVIFNGLLARAIMDIIELGGLLALSIFFTLVPNFTEYNWRKQVKFVILFDKETGTVVFSEKMSNLAYNVGKMNANLDEYLVASALTGVRMLLEKLNQGRPEEGFVRSFKQEDAFVCIEYGQKYALATICERPSETLERIMKVFIQKVEKLYQNVANIKDADTKIEESIRYIFRWVFLPPTSIVFKKRKRGEFQ